MIASIQIKDKDELQGAIQAYPSGHLLVVTGYGTSNQTRVVYVNDPANHDDNSVAKSYSYDQFLRAWKDVIYVIEPPL